MQDNALPAIEFVLFIAFAVWLFLWQGGKSRRPRDGDAPHGEAADDPSERSDNAGNTDQRDR